MYGLEYDAYALNTALKALNVIFIILILLTNGLLVFKNVRKCDFMYKTKTMIILSLAVGDILLALFPLVLQTKILFDIYAGTECSMIKPSEVYMYYLNSFVYGCGLMILGWEILNRDMNSGSRNNMLHAILTSSAPWFLGLVIILPLGFTNVDWLLCVGPSLDQVRATYVIANLLPAVGAVVASVFVKTRLSVQERHTQTERNNYPVNQYPNPPLTSPPPYAAQGSYPIYQQHEYTTPPSQRYPLQIKPGYNNFGTVPAPVMMQVSAPHNGSLERNRLLVTSVVFFLLVTPFTIYILAYVINDNDFNHLNDLVNVVLGNLFFYLMLLRPVITPVLTLGVSDM